ncbi:MAG: DUF1850 domain-containing protein [Selenomonas sp.]|uniref:DUF1850 domain-containing protein n=1 Tax=Selenomonas sp. TaxID=2053611 RepID=UPI0025E117BD|nr:DUF1850 domain-containing protein [Selenomonas sp.]MCR5756317.1 DUF1850 domain-containing protein [Selenomonas sp.]
MIFLQKEFLLCGLGIFLALWQILTLPCLIVRVGGERLYIGEAAAGFPLSLHFIHSVQKTPVEEYLAVDEARQGFILLATKYQSFGVGLPFDATEGEFSQEGNYYWLRGQKRTYTHLDLRIGVGTELALNLGGRSIPLYERYRPGTLVTIELMPLWKGLVMYE